MDIFIWNIALTAVLAFVGYVMKEKSDEIQRVGILLNKTREEVAREHITRGEVRADSQMLLDRLDRLEQKIDRLVEQHRA
jgi:uncharacterized membrane protein